MYIPKILKSRQKLFFFWSEEFQRQLQPFTARYVTVPTDLERKGDFSKSVDQNGNAVTVHAETASGLNAVIAGYVKELTSEEK